MKDRELILRAATLARTAPEAWTGFLEALAVHVEGLKDEMMQSPPDVTFINQGRARAVDGLLTKLRRAPAEADKLSQQSAKPYG